MVYRISRNLMDHMNGAVEFSISLGVSGTERLRIGNRTWYTLPVRVATFLLYQPSL